MFEDTDLVIILLPVIGVFVIVRIIEWRVGKNLPPMKKALNSLKFGLIMLGILTFVMLISIPSNYYLYSYPEQFNSFEEVHKYLLKHNRILMRMRDIIYWFLFFFCLMFLRLFYQFAKTIVTLKSADEGTQSKIFDFESKGGV